MPVVVVSTAVRPAVLTSHDDCSLLTLCVECEAAGRVQAGLAVAPCMARQGPLKGPLSPLGSSEFEAHTPAGASWLEPTVRATYYLLLGRTYCISYHRERESRERAVGRCGVKKIRESRAQLETL